MKKLVTPADRTASKQPLYIDSPSYRVEDDPWYVIVIGGAALFVLLAGLAIGLFAIGGLFL